MVEKIFRRSNPLPDNSSSVSEEIKTALQVKIFGREQKDGTYFYVIRTWLIYSPSEISDAIRKRYSQFFDLHNKLTMMGYQELPSFPGKKLFMTDKDKDERQNGLENYLKIIVNRKDTRNSQPVIEFLNINEFCPEIMFNVPQLIIKKEFSRNRMFVNCCLFLEQHNLYVISITDKSTRQSRFEIYSFRQTGLIQDQYKLKNPESFSSGQDRQSVVDILASPDNRTRKNTLFSSIPMTNDPQAAASVGL